MKQISALELHFLVKELKDLENSRVDKIYNNGKEEIYIQLHKSNAGRKLLRIIVGRSIFLTETKSVDEKPSGFCLLLRKNLEGKFLDSIKQLEPERILKFNFKSKNETKKLYLEFFGKGNVILCNNDGVIIDCSIKHKFKDRSILPKQNYIYPNMRYNLFNIDKKDIVDLLKNSKRDKVITCLATELGLGGVYSEEICLLSNIDKNNNPQKINNNEITKISDSIKEIINKKNNPQVVYKDKELIDAVPINLELYKANEKKEFSNYNNALNEYYMHELKFIKEKESPYAKKINELKWILGEQEDTLNNLKVKEIENRKKGELIYNNYQLIKEILGEINKANKKYSWKEIKDKLKGHKIVKDVDVKEKKIIVQI
ncbi:MAG: NFACT family protein [Nanoarchaeota archaeon]|nr:NFACT family protein [Nanoarchaeota archaeon]